MRYFESCFEIAAVYENVSGTATVLHEYAEPESFASVEAAAAWLEGHGYSEL